VLHHLGRDGGLVERLAAQTGGVATGEGAVDFDLFFVFALPREAAAAPFFGFGGGVDGGGGGAGGCGEVVCFLVGGGGGGGFGWWMLEDPFSAWILGALMSLVAVGDSIRPPRWRYTRRYPPWWSLCSGVWVKLIKS